MTNNQTNVLDTLHGLGLPPSLDAAEAQTWRRWLPGGRVPWRELASFETEIAELEERRREVERERDEIAARLQGAPAQDVEARARWERSGRRGARPEPSQPKLEAELKRCQDDLYALHAAIDKVSAERVAHVEKHRGRLSREAAEAAEKPTSVPCARSTRPRRRARRSCRHAVSRCGRICTPTL